MKHNLGRFLNLQRSILGARYYNMDAMNYSRVLVIESYARISDMV